MRTTIISSILAIAIAAPAFANPGADQLARTLGVEPGVYSLAELVRLDAAREEGGVDGAAAARFVLGGAADVVATSNPAGGVTVAEAGLIDEILDDNTSLSASTVLEGLRNDTTVSDRGVVTPGKAQIAAVLGVDPAAFTTAELVQLDAQRGPLSENN